jgi:hypothetical protein
MKSEFETWPATPVEASLEITEVALRYGTSRSASFLTNGAAGVGRPSTHCQLAIADCRFEEARLVLQSAIGN